MDPERVFRMQSDILDRIAAIPGVAAASLASAAPMEPFVSANMLFSEDRIHAEGKTRRFKFVSPGFFRTVGTPVVAGRDFEWTDLHQRRPVAVISENMAREMWRDPAAALGKRIRENPEGPWREIVGVVGDVFDDGVHAPAPIMAYWPALMENFEGEPIRVRRSMTLVIRSSRTGSEGFLKDIQQAVWAVNASLPLARVQTLDDIYERIVGADLLHAGDAGDCGGDGAAAGPGGDLRRHRLCRHPADTRNRHPRRARRAAWGTETNVHPTGAVLALSESSADWPSPSRSRG